MNARELQLAVPVFLPTKQSPQIDLWKNVGWHRLIDIGVSGSGTVALIWPLHKNNERNVIYVSVTVK